MSVYLLSSPFYLCSTMMSDTTHQRALTGSSYGQQVMVIGLVSGPWIRGMGVGIANFG